MGKGGKKSKLVKERPGNSKSGNEESVNIVRQPPSPIPEEAENAFVAQGSTHEEPIQNDHWNAGANLANAARAPGAWYASPRQSGAASPRTGDYGPNSWAGRSDSSSMSRASTNRDPPRRPSSPYPITASVDLDQHDSRSAEEGELDYISDERLGMDSNSNMQQWDTATQDQSQAPPPQTQQEQPQQPPLTGPSFNIYAKSFSNPPVAPNPLPPAPNVLSKASDAAARMDRSKKGDQPPQPQPILPLPPAAWHNWIKPGTYAPKPEPPAPPPAPHQTHPPQPFPHPTPASGPAVAGSILKGHMHNSTRGIWDLKHGKGLPAGAQMHQSRGRAHDVSGQWNQPRSRSSVDGWATQPAGGGFGAWNNNAWGAAGNDGGNRGHGRNKSEGGRGRTRNVQWQEESSSEETDDDDGYDDGWGEQDTSGWGQGGGSQAPLSKPDNAWGGRDQGGGQAQWPKQDNTRGGWDQGSGGQAQWPKQDNVRGGWDKGGGGQPQWPKQDNARDRWDQEGGGQAQWPKPDNARGGWDQGGGGQAQWSKPDNALGGWDQGGGGQAQRSKPGNTLGGWDQGGVGQAQWSKPGNALGGWDQGGGGQAQWPKPNNAWGGQDQGGWNQEDGLDHQLTNGHNWGEEKKSHYATNVHTAAAGDTRGMVSSQQKTQILNSLLNMSNMPNQTQAGQGGHAEHRSSRLASKRIRKEGKGQTQYNAGWGWGDESYVNTHEDDDDDDDDDEENEEEHRPTSKRVSASWGAWNGSQEASRYSMPSLTLAHAYKDSKTRLDPGAQSQLDDFTKIRFHESGGAALVQAQLAFFGYHIRPSRDRIHWSFPPDKDERVQTALNWVQEMTYGLATLGLHKYLQHRERGALFINADYRLPDRPQDFSVDYLPFDKLQYSRDQTLQVSVISYNPALTVIVFVFLPSKTGNSIAIWRRKLRVPNNVRLRFQKELAIARSGLKKPQDYEIHVEENLKVPDAKKDLPNLSKLGEQAKPKKKRKWWQLFKLFKSS